MNRIAIALIACATLVVAGCAGSAGLSSRLDVLPDSPLEAYRVSSGDRVNISVFGQPDLSGEVAIDAAGVVALPLVGSVDAEGATAQELSDRIAERLRDGYLSNPRVTVEVITFRPYYIFGEVNAPASYPYVSGLTVRQAVATAGGFTYRADQNRVFIKSAGEPDEVGYAISAATPVLPGDTIRVPDRRF